MKVKVCSSLLILSLLFSIFPTQTFHARAGDSEKLRQRLYETMETLTGVPWPYLAAMDQYEQNTRPPDAPKPKGLISIRVPSHLWAGLSNPNPNDIIPESIQFFEGIGRDANGDGKVDPADDSDVLYSVASYLTKNGSSERNVREQLWKYYQHPTSVDVITHIARVIAKNQTINLQDRSFPIPLQYNFTYHNTWGDRRGWGGLRIHEGTDIFAGYGTPVLSTCHGYVELLGWNRFGGWRVGIRDTNNNYHYFAHLNGFRKGLKQGDIVKPGEVIGSVGSSGYGPPGTSGKFPPHLHYGIYKFNGRNTYSFDPYPFLKKWERNAYQKRKELRKKRKHKRSQTTLKWID
ncbi:M23 family metallopeptidase [Paenactinomyces guangxiensis]|uniref:M23 family metallopeptidase n=1 Tax=Paenactinomyces guangxiensis TaxID=1490290 RepID=A0A7W2A8D0_9BACL|nr:M23 family metallopeptidase [Paenactinomyces guangxiensis]MBA4493698.1 M23 family metallopeptidase [Paenactinomyces guangxiensis]MBH8590985.1 M23 family metallopeptidase [Paenactinomyces guangxiensis]